MELEELLQAWKVQDNYINQRLGTITLRHLIEQKSKGILSCIVKRLTVELVAIIFIVSTFNLLYFITELPYTSIRWISFAIFNLNALLVILKYVNVISRVRLDFQLDVSMMLEKIINNLNRFRTQNRNFNIPLCLVCIIMFAGAQNLLSWLPWMLGEFFLWRWLLTPKFKKRFETYIQDLRFSLNKLKEMKD